MNITKNHLEQALHSTVQHIQQQLLKKLLFLGWSLPPLFMKEVLPWLQKNPKFIERSCFLYLGRRFVESKNKEELQRIFQQLITELVIVWCVNGPGTEFRWKGKQGSDFSPILNAALPRNMVSLKKIENTLYFFDEHGNDLGNRLCTPMYKVAPGTIVLIGDCNPYNAHNDHPDVPHVPYDLGGKQIFEWEAQFIEAFEIIAKADSELYDSILPFLDAIVPMGFTEGKQYSSSYSQSPLILYLSYTEHTTKQAEALVHEIHHTMFNLMDECFGLIKPNPEEIYFSAYRPDPRPLRGCFLGVHAFAPVVWMYTQIIEKGLSERSEILKGVACEAWWQNDMTLKTIQQHGELLPHGQLVIADCLEYQNRSLLKLKDYPQFMEKRQKVQEHYEQVKASFPPLKGPENMAGN